MTTTITLDWLAFTFKEDTHEAAAWLHTLASTKGASEAPATNGYRTAYRSEQGVVSMWNIDRPEMGYHVIIAGTTIRNVCEHYELDQKALLETVVNAGGSITRLDLAKDITNIECSLDKIYQACERGQNRGTARTFSQIHSLNGGNTIYVGSRQSEKFIRIYDKAAQMGQQHGHWKRYELETKGMVARSLADLLTKSKHWSDAFNSISRHMVDIPSCADYQAFFTEQFVDIGIPKIEKKSDREAWIEKQVMPAVIKHLTENPNSEAIALLERMLAMVRKQQKG